MFHNLSFVFHGCPVDVVFTFEVAERSKNLDILTSDPFAISKT